MKIAIVTSFPSHLECIGYLLEILPTIPDVYINKDPHHDIEYFKSIYNFNSQHISKLDENAYDFVIKLSSNDVFNIKNTNKQISLLHISGWDPPTTKHYITLAPESIVTTKHHFKHILPVYKGITSTDPPKNTIVYIGAFADSYLDDDLINFIKECAKINYNFIFCVNGTNIFVNTALFKQFNNVTVKCNISTPELINLVKTSKYILCRKYPHQSRKVFSGCITIGLSHDIPFIMQQEISELYGKLPCLSFNKNYSEIIDTLKIQTEKEYNILKNNHTTAKNDAIVKGKVIISDFLNKIRSDSTNYVSTNKEIIGNYDFYPTLDSKDHDLCHVRGCNLQVLKELANSYDKCVAFNTYGYLKHKVDTNNLIMLPNCTSNIHGLYVKRT